MSMRKNAPSTSLEPFRRYLQSITEKIDGVAFSLKHVAPENAAMHFLAQTGELNSLFAKQYLSANLTSN
jgi:hypothetical protein